jgi:hypothetical protein
MVQNANRIVAKNIFGQILDVANLSQMKSISREQILTNQDNIAKNVGKFFFTAFIFSLLLFTLFFVSLFCFYSDSL